MKNINISNEIKELCPDTILGCIQARVKVQDSTQELDLEISDYCKIIREKMVVADISKQKNIQDTRKAYRRLGKDPTRYRSSAEALARRVLKGQDLYSINNIVEINNLVSLKSLYPVCAYDLTKIQGDISLLRASEGTVYDGIGRGPLKIEYLPVFSDSLGYFGSTTSDSERVIIEKSSQDLLMIIVSFNGMGDLEKYVNEMYRLLKTYGFAKKMEVNFIS